MTWTTLTVKCATHSWPLWFKTCCHEKSLLSSYCILRQCFQLTVCFLETESNSLFFFHSPFSFPMGIWRKGNSCQQKLKLSKWTSAPSEPALCLPCWDLSLMLQIDFEMTLTLGNLTQAVMQRPVLTRLSPRRVSGNWGQSIPLEG